MKKWIKFFCLSFFSDKISREAAKRGYTNVFIGLILAFVLLWMGSVGGDVLPFRTHYDNSPDFQATVHGVLSNSDLDKRIIIEIQDGVLKAKKHGGEYAECLLVNTLENDVDKQNYSINGYDVIVDTRPADALAEVEVYCVSNNGDDMVISYQDYLSLNDANKLNFDFKLNYTGKELVLSDETVAGYKSYLEKSGSENKGKVEELKNDLIQNVITKSEYNRAVYELYFADYYPEITAYESTSKVPLLRNYYYHNYIKEGHDKYLFIFDDYMAGSFETEGGTDISFYGFYSDLKNGTLVAEGSGQDEANALADGFVNKSYSAIVPLTLYANAMNVFSLIPFIALMPMVVTLLAYSLLKLRGIESIATLGEAFKIIGSYVWVSAAISAVLTVITAFFVQRNILAVLPLLLFFVTLAIRSIVFAIGTSKSYLKQSEQ